MIALVVVTSQDGGKAGMADTFSDDNTCMTEGCIGNHENVQQKFSIVMFI